MKIIVREKADADLDHIFGWVAQRNPRAATELIRGIRARIGHLETPSLARIGRPGLEQGTRAGGIAIAIESAAIRGIPFLTTAGAWHAAGARVTTMGGTICASTISAGSSPVRPWLWFR